jgi:hypothetical protein
LKWQFTTCCLGMLATPVFLLWGSVAAFVIAALIVSQIFGWFFGWLVSRALR